MKVELTPQQKQRIRAQLDEDDNMLINFAGFQQWLKDGSADSPSVGTATATSAATTGSAKPKNEDRPPAGTAPRGGDRQSVLPLGYAPPPSVVPDDPLERSARSHTGFAGICLHRVVLRPTRRRWVCRRRPPRR